MSIAVMTYFIIVLLGRKRHVETETWIKIQRKIDRETERDTHARATKCYYYLYLYIYIYMSVCIVVIAVAGEWKIGLPTGMRTRG